MGREVLVGGAALSDKPTDSQEQFVLIPGILADPKAIEALDASLTQLVRHGTGIVTAVEKLRRALGFKPLVGSKEKTE